MDDHCKQYPSNTAPAGYTCPTCCSALFPPSNLVSPVADVLRTVLMNRPWAREGLGLPLLPFDPTDNQSSQGEAISSSLKETPVNYSVVNVETDTPNTFHRNEPGTTKVQPYPSLIKILSDFFYILEHSVQLYKIHLKFSGVIFRYVYIYFQNSLRLVR